MTRRGIVSFPLLATHGVLIATALCATPARAQSVDAEYLFQLGKRLIKEGDIPGACKAFAESLHQEQAIGTMMSLADCREREGKLASAWSTFLNAASLATRSGSRPLADEAKRRAELVAPRLSYLTISVADANRIEGLTILRDDDVVSEALWNQGVPIDGGHHVVVASAVGNQPVSIDVEVTAESDRATVEVPRLKRIEDFAKPTGGQRQGGEGEGEDRDDVDEARRTSRMTPLRWGGVGSVTAGGVSLVAGAVFGMKANDAASRARTVCPTDPCSDAGALELSAQSGRDATRANIAFIAGGVLVAGGVVLWIVGAPHQATVHRSARLVPFIQSGEAGLVVQGRF